MPVIMQLAGRPNLVGGFDRLPQDGQFLVEFDFEAGDGTGSIFVHPDSKWAKRFPDMAAAIAFRQRQPVCRPMRSDGQPNRPLTSTNWLFFTVEESADAPQS